MPHSPLIALPAVFVMHNGVDVLASNTVRSRTRVFSGVVRGQELPFRHGWRYYLMGRPNGEVD